MAEPLKSWGEMPLDEAYLDLTRKINVWQALEYHSKAIAKQNLQVQAFLEANKTTNRVKKLVALNAMEERLIVIKNKTDEMLTLLYRLREKLAKF